MAVVWAFPGQGSQRKNMAEGLFERFPAIAAEADAVLGRSVRELCDDPALLQDTRNLQPVMFTINALKYLDLAGRSPQPDFMAGHSLGEYSALYAAGAVDFSTGLRLVSARADIMARATGGAMLAVVGLEADRIERVLSGVGASDVDVANYNSPLQTVLSGPEESVRALAPVLRREGAGKCVLLYVSVAAHSRYVREAADELGAVLDTVDFRAPRVPVLSNVTALPHRAEEIGALLREHMVRPVRWWDSMRYLAGQGVTELVEVGPGSVLGKLWATVEQPEPARPAAAVPVAVPPPAPVAAPRPAPAPARPNPQPRPGAGQLGAPGFRERYGVRLAHAAGASGAGTPELCARMAAAGLLSFADRAADVPVGAARGGWGMALRDDPTAPAAVSRFLEHGVRHVEADFPAGPTADLVRFRFRGARRHRDGTPVSAHHVIARVTGIEQAAAFLAAPSRALLMSLVAGGGLTEEEAEAARGLPVASDLAVETSAGWSTDCADAFALLPAITALVRRVTHRNGYPEPVHVGVRGAAGTPERTAAAFALGADFTVTTSVNQCTPQSLRSRPQKEKLSALMDQDLCWAPGERHFALGARTRVVRVGTLFPARANHLYRLYRDHRSFDEIPAATRAHVERACLGRSFDEVTAVLTAPGPEGPGGPRHRMASVFRWYLREAARVDHAGEPARPLDHRLDCDTELADFNRRVAGTELAPWTARDADTVAEYLLTGAAELIGAAGRRCGPKSAHR
ncbi:[acyl-carrier-protein] S-malonyltransferase [Streptomyces sp. CB01201]|uniref:ACP S-malonyltransferase n=1 Tax=unclassified Streptomyces TaxID=2593676 RepID=UPI000C279E5B|nr:ACP S-malonyltransferase [Streptomyces sp. CB01201]PJN02050.1 [acyl-carrier-protein] S-malonyltransferase [Streptomyces sp. CB01201]